MPNETVLRNDDAPGSRLAVQWGKQGGADPKVVMTTWTQMRGPDGRPSGGEWCPGSAVWDLDRESINKLIRTLRRARDQAYGRDE